MDKKFTVIGMKDLEDMDSRELRNYLVMIGDKNEQLYKKLLHVLKQDDFQGMREDVLKCFADNAGNIRQDNEFVFYLLSLIEDLRITPDYYVWLIEYCNNTDIDISDVMISFTVAIEKNMPLEAIKECFDSDDFLLIFESIEQYREAESQEDKQNTDRDDAEEMILTEESGKSIEDNGMVSVFGDLLTIMTMGKSREEGVILSAQDRFEGIVSALRQSVDDVSSFFAKIVHEWDMDKEEILRLKAIYNIQQRVLSNQHQKMYEADREIARLRAALYEAEKRESQYETISKKVLELQTMTASSSLLCEDI